MNRLVRSVFVSTPMSPSALAPSRSRPLILTVKSLPLGGAVSTPAALAWAPGSRRLSPVSNVPGWPVCLRVAHDRASAVPKAAGSVTATLVGETVVRPGGRAAYDGPNVACSSNGVPTPDRSVASLVTSNSDRSSPLPTSPAAACGTTYVSPSADSTVAAPTEAAPAAGCTMTVAGAPPAALRRSTWSPVGSVTRVEAAAGAGAGVAAVEPAADGMASGRDSAAPGAVDAVAGRATVQASTRTAADVLRLRRVMAGLRTGDDKDSRP